MKQATEIQVEDMITVLMRREDPDIKRIGVQEARDGGSATGTRPRIAEPLARWPSSCRFASTIPEGDARLAACG
ncbi:MAG: hypothetical protein JO211_07415 [Acidobacteriaceae bacterium]|nr:hypothetical protein [Acidobacteriaceae bacterium]